MNGLVLALLLGLVTWAGVVLLGRAPRHARVPVASAVLLGLSGYVVWGTPGASGAPVTAPEAQGFGEELVDPRRGMGERFNEASQWLGMADGLMRTGRTRPAAQILEQGLRRYPRNVDLWVAYGNALVAHSGGLMTPAAEMAFARAAALEPDHPAPAFFSGLALAQGGDLAGARAVWQALLDRSLADAPWREDLAGRLAAMPPQPPAQSSLPSSAQQAD